MGIGKKIPDMEFEVYHEGEVKKMKFSGFKGKWLVVAFYPADFTFVCPTELESFAENYDKFKEENAEVISFSTDTVYVHKAWHDTSKAISKVNYPMGSDPSGKICKAFGTYIEDEGLSLRATFIFDEEGVLRAFEMHDNSIGRSVDEILRKLIAAKYVKENQCATPAGWKKGEEVLKPSLELVGKI